MCWNHTAIEVVRRRVYTRFSFDVVLVLVFIWGKMPMATLAMAYE